MDLNQALADLKKEPGFTDHVGMVLIHNGVVRGWSRKNRDTVTSIRVQADMARIEALRREFEARPGIFRVIVEALPGEKKPGDDLLFLIVAGDIRENVKAALSELLDRVKAEAITKQEITA